MSAMISLWYQTDYTESLESQPRDSREDGCYVQAGYLCIPVNPNASPRTSWQHVESSPGIDSQTECHSTMPTPCIQSNASILAILNPGTTLQEGEPNEVTARITLGNPSLMISSEGRGERKTT